jgi:hypothetical protein
MRLTPSLYPFYGGRQLVHGDGNRSAFAFIGLPLDSPYDVEGVRSPAAEGPEHVRKMSWEQECHTDAHHYDFDVDGPLMPSGRRSAPVEPHRRRRSGPGRATSGRKGHVPDDERR